MAASTQSPSSDPATDADVVIIGNGPTGQTLSLLLAHRGWRVIVLERYPTSYPFPRVVGFDAETARNFSAAGIGDKLPEITERMGEYEFQNGSGTRLIHWDIPYEPGRDGYPRSMVIHHPTLEATLTEYAKTVENLTVLLGHKAEQVLDHGDHVEISAPGPDRESTTVTARWLVSCDGANSFVREQIGATATDLGYKQDWLMCDMLFEDGREFHPNNLQICNPLRPTTVVASGRGHRRWEFRRLPGESLEELNRPETVWRLLEPFGATPENSTLCRHAMYTFEARIVDNWRAGRILLAGDAVHLMPPFAGQGMCSGIRDAANVAWKLDLVLRGIAGDDVMDSYPEERIPQVSRSINASVELGRIISELDTVAAAERDTRLIAMQEAGGAAALSSSSFPLAQGILRRDASGDLMPLAGDLTPQGRVARGTESGLFDDVIGRGFVLLTTIDPRSALGGDDLAFLERIGTHLVRVLPSGTAPESVAEHEMVDLDDAYLPYLAEAEQLGVLIRPDFYAFGASATEEDLPTLVSDLRKRLTARTPAPSASVAG